MSPQSSSSLVRNVKIKVNLRDGKVWVGLQQSSQRPNGHPVSGIRESVTAFGVGLLSGDLVVRIEVLIEVTTNVIFVLRRRILKCDLNSTSDLRGRKEWPIFLARPCTEQSD